MIYYYKIYSKEGNIMWKNFLKKSSWNDLIISLIFILFGTLLVAKPDSVISFISILLGGIVITMGILKIIDYVSNDKKDNYLLSIAVVAMIAGIIIMFCSEIILSLFRILIGIWIIYSGIMNLQTAIVWKDYKSKLWLTILILSLATIIAGIYVLVNSGAILQTIGVIIIGYGIVDIIADVIFIKKIDNYLE